MEWTVNELAERAGITDRALRHYHRIGLLPPDRIGSNGYRYYGPDAVARLQRILLLRDTGMGLAEIAAVLDAPAQPMSEVDALRSHLDRLTADRDAVDRRIAAVEHTLAMREQGLEPRMDVMLQGFNDDYESEVVERWGRDAFEPRRSSPGGASCRRRDTNRMLRPRATTSPRIWRGSLRSREPPPTRVTPRTPGRWCSAWPTCTRATPPSTSPSAVPPRRGSRRPRCAALSMIRANTVVERRRRRRLRRDVDNRPQKVTTFRLARLRRARSTTGIGRSAVLAQRPRLAAPPCSLNDRDWPLLRARSTTGIGSRDAGRARRM
jgi:DNA-binding transcriptional MerR regulator